MNTVNTPDELVAALHIAGECTCVYTGDIDAIDFAAFGMLDWAVYEHEDGVLVHASRIRFLPLLTDSPLIKRKSDRYLIYVLCPTHTDLAAAKDTFKEHPWAVPIVIPTTFYLESVMYFHVLPRRRTEWEHADYVGTIAHSAHRKLQSIPAILDVLRAASEKQSDVAAFMMRKLPLIQVAEMWHPGFLKVWVPALQYHGFPFDKIVSPDILPFYCNYWAATPQTMNTYIEFFSSFRVTLETLQGVCDDIWKDSGYHRSGPDNARITPDRCEEIWGTRHYPFHPFVCERLPCFFFWVMGKNVLAVPL